MSVIFEKFNQRISELKSDFNINKKINHQGLKGGFNENELASLIESIIPKKYKITKGLIENSKGQQSNETDIIIYDDEILPPYIKDDIAFVPVEAVKYNFEVKSKLNATELKTTINKFKNFQKIGGKSPTVLFSFSTDLVGCELSRYYKYDDSFYMNPAISVLCISNKSYFYKDVIEHHLKDFFPAKNLIKENKYLLDSCTYDELMKNSDDLIINGIQYSDITFKIHRWISLESSNNNIELAFFSGISNTLCKSHFGSYLINMDKQTTKVVASCYEDMWGNISCKQFDKNGINNTTNFSFISDEQSHRIIFNTISEK